MAGTQLLTKRPRFDRSHQALPPLQETYSSSNSRVPPIKLNLSEVGGYSDKQTPKDSLYSTSHGHAVKSDSFSQSLDILHQYKENFKGDASLSFRSLPPIKVSYKTKRKFMESPRSDRNGPSSIIKPGYSLRTYRQGHHVFTEGISDISRTRNPSFALQKVQVPYSNLPDNIQVYKEKNQFAFGGRPEVKEERHSSPYKLSSKPFGVENANFARTIEVGKSVNDKFSSKGQSHFKGPKKTPKSKVILEPIRKPGQVDKKLLTEVEQRATGDSFLNTPLPSKSKRGSFAQQKLASDRSLGRESRVSVVSIGDTVSPDHFDRQKKSTRTLYPMYDWRSLQTESYKQTKFGLLRPGSGKTGTSSTTGKSSKLNTTFLQLENDIDKDARRRKHLQYQRARSNLIHSDRDLFHVDYGTGRANGYKQGRNKIQQWRPKSSSSNSTTDASQFPLNPPPSEISQYVMDEFAHHATSDYRAEMLTLLEEREKTLLATSYGNRDPESNGPQQTDVSVNKETEHVSEKEIYEGHTGEDSQVSSAAKEELSNIPKLPEIAVQDTQEHGLGTDRSSSIQQEKFVPESLRQNIEVNVELSTGQIIVQDEVEGSDLEDPDKMAVNRLPIEELHLPIIEATQNNERSMESTRNGFTGRTPKATPKLLVLPTVSLEKQSSHPMARHSHIDSTSFSRKMQNTPVVPMGTRKSKEPPRPEVEKENTRDRLKLPVTQVKLYGELNDADTMHTQSISLTDTVQEEEPETVISEATPTLRTDEDRCSVKKIVNSTTIAFKSPMETEANAKRQ